MKKQTESKPTISVNIKYSTILIHKNTWKLLGSPEYIQILVNPSDKSIVIYQSSQIDHLAHCVNSKGFTDYRKPLRIISYALVRELQSIYPKWNEDNTYKMKGKFLSHLNIIKFSMDESYLSSRYGNGDADD